MTNYAEAIYQHSLTLPEAAAREALDFIEFLVQRYGTLPANVESVSIEADARRQAALRHLAGVQAPWGGKPITDRDALHDEARG